MKVVFAGEKGSFAELAAREYFGHDVNLQQVKLFDDVFDTVKKDINIRGIIPIENTKAGSVHKNYDLLLESKCFIVGEIYLKIEQCLIANKGVSLRNIKRVFSHPQALEQCRNFLKRHPKIKPFETVNTAASVKMIKEEKLIDAAAIASVQAAIDFDMEILGQNIQDDKNNMTRFLILSKKTENIQNKNLPIKTSIVFSMKNIPGALFRSLAVFSLRDIDLYKIESRPMFGHGFQYLFYLDFEGDAKTDKPRRALNHLQEMTTFYRFLGSYPLGKTVEPKYIKRSILNT